MYKRQLQPCHGVEIEAQRTGDITEKGRRREHRRRFGVDETREFLPDVALLRHFDRRILRQIDVDPHLDALQPETGFEIELVDIMALFQGKDGRYHYSNGINWAAIIAWVISFIFPFFTYFGVTGAFWTFINSINYIWSFVIGFILYLILMKTPLAGNSHVTEEEHEAFTQRG